MNSVWTRPHHYAGYNPEGHICVMARHRDSDLLSESNWDACIAMLSAVNGGNGPEEFSGQGWSADPDKAPMFYTWTASHCMVGWVEYLMLRPDAPKALLDEATRIAEKLESYPVLDEDDWSNREYEATCDYWEQASIEERVHECQRAGVSVFAARHDHIENDRLFQWVHELANR